VERQEAKNVWGIHKKCKVEAAAQSPRSLPLWLSSELMPSAGCPLRPGCPLGEQRSALESQGLRGRWVRRKGKQWNYGRGYGHDDYASWHYRQHCRLAVWPWDLGSFTRRAASVVLIGGPANVMAKSRWLAALLASAKASHRLQGLLE